MTSKLPLEGIKVVDFGHTVMGPSAGLILADLGADVTKIEPTNGDPTRVLKGFGAGYFGFFNRNKRSLAVDLKSAAGKDVVCKLLSKSDVLIENFAPGTMARLGLDYDQVKNINPKLIYASLKGFLRGPYEARLALDEVIQMMTGLAYMTGPTGKPLRAGTSVVDITGGMFAVIGILSALRDRDLHGEGRLVETALFETSTFLMGQHLCYSAHIDTPIPPMPERVSAWAIYDLFNTSEGEQIFVGITADSQWKRFCDALGLQDFLDNPAYATNADRIAARDELMPRLQSLLATMSRDEVIEVCEAAVIPFAPVARPEDLFDDEHLRATGGLLSSVLPNGTEVALPRTPIRISGNALDRNNAPPYLGAHSRRILAELGYGQREIEALIKSGSIVSDDMHALSE